MDFGRMANYHALIEYSDGTMMIVTQDLIVQS